MKKLKYVVGGKNLKLRAMITFLSLFSPPWRKKTKIMCGRGDNIKKNKKNLKIFPFSPFLA